MSAEPTITIALAGNPNAGKSTIFNALTDSRQHVGNYPGVTVQTSEGRAEYDGKALRVVDLPGTYSLTARSNEEVVARNFILDENPDVVVDIVDAANLERNLYLTTQLMELGVPVVVVFNKSDLALSGGLRIDHEKLSQLMGVPIVPTVGPTGEGTDRALAAAVATALDGPGAIERQRHCNYGSELEPHIRQLTGFLRETCDLARHTRWFAVKLLEDDTQTHRRLQRLCPQHMEIIDAEVGRLRTHLRGVFGDAPEIVLADRRYGFLSGACTEAVVQTVEARHERTDRIDAILTHPVLGLPIFAVMMYLVFFGTFTLGEPPMHWIESGFQWLAATISGWWPAESDSLLRSVLVDGVIGGVGGVIVFVPNIALLFLGIAILEDSGYMARAAFIMDRFMHKIGLHGKSFIPLLIGFGCSVPAIMATRTLESRRDRLTTMLIVPLMSCGARLTIYALLIPAFFPPAWRAPVLWSLYIIGIVLALVAAKLLRKTLFRGESAPFVMELPLYRTPTARGLVRHMGERTWLYLRKAGTVILLLSVILWALTQFPRKTEFDRDYTALAAAARQGDATATGAEATAIETRLRQLDNQKRAEELAFSIVGRIGRFLEPVWRPMGFDWKIGTALIGATAAKEVFVAQMGIVYSVSMGEAGEGSDSLRQRLRETYSPLVAYCVMLFCLISTPCVATVAATWQESGSWKFAALQVGGLTVGAYIITVIVYQIGSLWV